jgi:hypothetical protein
MQRAIGDGDKRQFDTIYYNDKGTTASDCEIIDSAWLLRPAVAKELMPEPKAPEITVPGGGGSTKSVSRWTTCRRKTGTTSMTRLSTP